MPAYCQCIGYVRSLTLHTGNASSSVENQTRDAIMLCFEQWQGTTVPPGPVAQAFCLLIFTPANCHFPSVVASEPAHDANAPPFEALKQPPHVLSSYDPQAAFRAIQKKRENERPGLASSLVRLKRNAPGLVPKIASCGPVNATRAGLILPVAMILLALAATAAQPPRCQLQRNDTHQGSSLLMRILSLPQRTLPGQTPSLPSEKTPIPARVSRAATEAQSRSGLWNRPGDSRLGPAAPAGSQVYAEKPAELGAQDAADSRGEIPPAPAIPLRKMAPRRQLQRDSSRTSTRIYVSLCRTR